MERSDLYASSPPKVEGKSTTQGVSPGSASFREWNEPGILSREAALDL
jgi:hypothetical protein